MKKLVSCLVLTCAACSSSSTDATSATPAPDAGTAADADASGRGGGSCSTAMEQLLSPVDRESAGAVTVLSESDGLKTVYVDASAGGAQESSKNPRLYLNLETVTRAAVTDRSAATSTEWDLAIKRPVLFTNSGHGGSGQGGAVFVAGKDIATVTSADADGRTFASEVFVDAECNPQVDQTNAVKTSFDGWYDYDEASNGLTPRAGTWIVKGGTGKLYKLAIETYYADPDGRPGKTSGRFTFRIGAL